MVKLTGSHEFDAPREDLWAALQDPNVLSQVLPGCERLEQKSENEYEGEINIKVGPVQGSFKGTVNLSDIDPPNSYRMELMGQGRPGFVKGSGTLRLEGDGPTTLQYDGEAQLSGRIASVGQRLVDSTARSLTRQGLQSLEKIIQARMEPPPAQDAPSTDAPSAGKPPGDGPSSSPEPEPVTPSTVEVGVNVARDVAADLAKDMQQRYGPRELLIIGIGFAAIVWMWRRLFGKRTE